MDITRWVKIYSKENNDSPVAIIDPVKVSVSFYRDCAILCPDNPLGELTYGKIVDLEKLLSSELDVFAQFDPLTEKDIERCGGKFRITEVGKIERLTWDQDRIGRVPN